MQDITKTFPGVLANDHVTIECNKGEVLGLLGENGAGKTTLMNILYGLYPPDEGQVFIDGKEVSIHSPSEAIENGIGMVHQHFKLVDTLTVIENVILGMPTNKAVLDLAPAREKFKKLCDEYELFVDPDTEVWKLPVGQQQWVEILKALYRDCKVLVLDEPTAAMGIHESHCTMGLLKELRDRGMTQLIISHNLHQVFDLADYIYVMRSGRIMAGAATQSTSPDELRSFILHREEEAL